MKQVDKSDDEKTGDDRQAGARGEASVACVVVATVDLTLRVAADVLDAGFRARVDHESRVDVFHAEWLGLLALAQLPLSRVDAGIDLPRRLSWRQVWLIRRDVETAFEAPDARDWADQSADREDQEVRQEMSAPVLTLQPLLPAATHSPRLA